MATTKNTKLKFFLYALLLLIACFFAYSQNLHRVYGNLSLMFIDKKDFKKARKFARKAIELNPKYANAYNTLGTIEAKENNVAAAEEDFRRALVLNPSFAGAIENLGYLLLLTSQYEKAVDHFETALLQKLSSQVRQDIQIKLAGLYLKQGNTEEALSIVEEIMTINPSAETLMQLSQTFKFLGLRGVAVSLLKTCTRLYPKAKEAYLFLGTILANDGHYKRAIRVWEEGSKVDPQDKRFTNNINKARTLQMLN